MQKEFAKAKVEMMACRDAHLLWELIKQNWGAADNEVNDHFNKLRSLQKNVHHGYDKDGIHYDPNDMIGR